MDYDKSRVFRRVKACIAVLPIALFTVPAAEAIETYAGIGYAQVESEDLETDNLVLTIGRSAEKGPGFEAFYAPAVGEDETSAGPIDVDVTIDSYGVLLTYTSGTDDFNGYLKFKAGLAVVDLEFDFEGLGSVDDDTSGLAYGIAFGVRIGDGALEVSYLILPEFDDFEGIEVDAEVDMLAISYLWYFE